MSRGEIRPTPQKPRSNSVVLCPRTTYSYQEQSLQLLKWQKTVVRKIRRKKGPAIPQSARRKSALNDVEWDLKNLSECAKRLSEANPPAQFAATAGVATSVPLTPNQLSAGKEYFRYLNQLAEDVKKLVRLDNTQLHHPAVRWLLSRPLPRESLRHLHHRLEKGVKSAKEIKGILGKTHWERSGNTITVSNIIHENRPVFFPGRGKPLTEIAKLELETRRKLHRPAPKPYKQIQMELEERGLIKKMTQQNFSKLVRRLSPLNFNPGPYYNVGALPPRPKKVPPQWIRAEKLLASIFPDQIRDGRG